MNAVASEILYDVFLSYSPGAGGDAVEMVRTAFSAAGLNVFDARDSMVLGDEIQDQIWRALAVSDAIVVVATPATLTSSWTAVEIGAAQAWAKPVFIIQPTVPLGQLPDFLTRFQIVPMSRLDDVVQAIRTRRAPWNGTDADLFRETYLELGIPADQLLMNPSKLALFAQHFNQRNHSELAAETLAQELVSMRKRGDLPQLRRRAQSG